MKAKNVIEAHQKNQEAPNPRTLPTNKPTKIIFSAFFLLFSARKKKSDSKKENQLP